MKTQSLPARIRLVRKELAQLRQQYPVLGRTALQEQAESECLRLAAMLDRLDQQQRAQMVALTKTQ